jgi:thiol-disulfide isomerase/thioredoxin
MSLVLAPRSRPERGPLAVCGLILSEDQAVRTSISLGLVAVCLGLAGCSLFNKKQNAQSTSGGSRPFLGSGPSSSQGSADGGNSTAAVTDPNAPLPGANALLAGQVIDRLNRRPSRVFIQVIDLKEDKPGAKVEVEAPESGYFVVQGLQLGHHYRLIARAKDGDKELSGTTIAMPPNPRLSIYLTEESNPHDSGQSGGPGKSGGGQGAGLDAPIKTPQPKSEGAPSSSTGGPSAGIPGSVAPPNPANIANGNPSNNGGFQHMPSAPNVSMPSPPPGPSYNLPPTPTPSGSGGPREDPALSAPALPAPEGPAVRLPNVPPPVPSCVVTGSRVENFALYDINGQVWEFRRHRVGKLVLMDFWFSSCAVCLTTMPHVNDLQRKYTQYGLEVLSVADEQGTPREQESKVRGVRGRYGITYTTLLCGGAYSPVRSQLRIQKYPTLILLDDRGEIVWHSKGNYPDEDLLRDLETEIHRRLGIR